jgi:glycosyltransferase involved in cell wall biosynthesis
VTAIDSAATSTPRPPDPPTVSVVIPAFNAEHYLAEAIDSVLAQTGAPLECIVVDDGSNDGTRRIAEAYGGKVRCLSRPNQGVSAARNAGIEAARGELIAFLDADDVWVPDKLERQTRLFCEVPGLVFSYGGIELVDARLAPLGSPIPAVPPPEAVHRTLMLRPGGFGLAITGLIRREVLEALGGFDPRLSTSADGDLALRLVNAGEGRAIEDVMARYRHHGPQMHHDLEVFERDWRLVLDRAFRLPLLADRPRLARRAYAELEWVLALSNWRTGRRGRGLSHAARSLTRTPAAALGRLAERALSRRDG